MCQLILFYNISSLLLLKKIFSLIWTSPVSSHEHLTQWKKLLQPCLQKVQNCQFNYWIINTVSLNLNFTHLRTHFMTLAETAAYWHPDPKIGPQVYLGPIKTSQEHRGKQWWDASLCAMACFHKFFSWQRRVCDINAFVVTEICLAKFTSVFWLIITGLQNVQNIKCDICLGNL